jgi:hypothetical protein
VTLHFIYQTAMYIMLKYGDIVKKMVMVNVQNNTVKRKKKKLNYMRNIV